MDTPPIPTLPEWGFILLILWYPQSHPQLSSAAASFRYFPKRRRRKSSWAWVRLT